MPEPMPHTNGGRVKVETGPTAATVCDFRNFLAQPVNGGGIDL